MADSPEHFQISIHDIRAWVSARARLLTEVAEITRRLDAAVQLFPALKSEVEPAAPAREGRTFPAREESLPTYLLNVLTDAPEGLTYGQLREAMNASPFAERNRRTPNAIYGAITYLTQRGDAAKRGQLVFAAPVLSRLLAERGDDWQPAGEEEGPAELILSFLKDRPEGARAGEIRQRLVSTPEFKDKVGTSKNYAYNRLARMVLNGSLVKEGEVYRLPRAVSEDSPSKTEGDNREISTRLSP